MHLTHWRTYQQGKEDKGGQIFELWSEATLALIAKPIPFDTIEQYDKASSQPK
jgi:hypothetical protein